jgi:hypothetical protein
VERVDELSAEELLVLLAAHLERAHAVETV